MDWKKRERRRRNERHLRRKEKLEDREVMWRGAGRGGGGDGKSGEVAS